MIDVYDEAIEKILFTEFDKDNAINSKIILLNSKYQFNAKHKTTYKVLPYVYNDDPNNIIDSISKLEIHNTQIILTTEPSVLQNIPKKTAKLTLTIKNKLIFTYQILGFTENLNTITFNTHVRVPELTISQA